MVKFVFTRDHRIKMKEIKKIDKYLDFAIVLNKMGSMKVTVIPVVIRTLWVIREVLVKRLEIRETRGKTKTILTTTVLKK